MAKHTIPIEDISQLVITSAGGSLYLTGWNREEIRVKDPSEQDLIKKEKGKVQISFPKDGIVHLPHHLPVFIKSVGKDVVIKGVSSPLQISSVGGDLSLSDVSSTTVDSAGGDIFAKRIQGDLVIKNVGKDCLVENVNGQLSLQQVGKDIQIEKITGGIEAKAGGDAQINFSPVPWQAYKINTGGDLSIAIPEDCNVDLSIKSKKEDITISLGDIDEKVKEKELTKQIGEGGPAVMLSAGGKVFVSSDMYSWLSPLRKNAEELGNIAIDFSDQTAEQFKDHFIHIEEDLRESFSNLGDSLDSIGLSEEKLKRIKTQIEESGLLTAQKAEMAAVKAQAKVEKSIAKAQLKARDMKRKTREFDLSEFLETQAEKKTVSDSERLMILNMLQDKKITPEEADDLLEALEGKK
ncbi:MAG: DUF4097 domain-containing protein [Anaerolineales bacterium]|nr:DUF4097 domain-containing protein [Anaerolineales bacterium]